MSTCSQSQPFIELSTLVVVVARPDRMVGQYSDLHVNVWHCGGVGFDIRGNLDERGGVIPVKSVCE